MQEAREGSGVGHTYPIWDGSPVEPPRDDGGGDTPCRARDGDSRPLLNLDSGYRGDYDRWLSCRKREKKAK